MSSPGDPDESVGLDIRRAIPVVHGDDPVAARAFYEGLLGMRVAMDQDGMLMFASRTTPTTQVIVTWPSPTALDPELLQVDISIEVPNADLVFAQASDRGLPIVRGLRDEPWGIRRFFVEDPTGLVVNVAAHLRPGSDSTA